MLPSALRHRHHEAEDTGLGLPSSTALAVLSEPLTTESVMADTGTVTDRRVGRLLGVVAVALELPLALQVFVVHDDLFDLGWLFLFALWGASLALAAFALSAGQRDRIGISLACFGLGGGLVPVLVVWAVLAAFEQG